MKKFLAVACAFWLGTMFSTIVAAQVDDTGSVQLGVNLANIKQDNRFPGFLGNDDTFNTTDIFFRLSGRINHYFSSELRLGTTVSDKSSGGNSLTHDYHAGGYLKLRKDLGSLSPYLVAGYTYGQETADIQQSSTSTFSSESYGVGADVLFNGSFGLNFEYMIYYDISSVERKGFSLGVFRTF